MAVGASRVEEAYRRPLTAQAAVVEAVRRSIVSAELRPGERVRQEALATKFGVSTIPVREALKVLEVHGLLTYEPHRGYAVANLTPEKLEELYLTRRLLETEALRRAVPKSDHTLIERLDDLWRELGVADATDDVQRFIDANRDFHLAIFWHAGLPTLYKYIEVLWQNCEPYRTVLHTYRSSRSRVLRETKRLRNAVLRGDPDLAVQLLDKHRNRVVADIRTALGGTEPRPLRR